jgi:hypothetical protein
MNGRYTFVLLFLLLRLAQIRSFDRWLRAERNRKSLGKCTCTVLPHNTTCFLANRPFSLFANRYWFSSRYEDCVTLAIAFKATFLVS